jgi:hypothetical protein
MFRNDRWRSGYSTKERSGGRKLPSCVLSSLTISTRTSYSGAADTNDGLRQQESDRLNGMCSSGERTELRNSSQLMHQPRFDVHIWKMGSNSKSLANSDDSSHKIGRGPNHDRLYRFQAHHIPVESRSLGICSRETLPAATSGLLFIARAFQSTLCSVARERLITIYDPTTIVSSYSTGSIKVGVPLTTTIGVAFLDLGQRQDFPVNHSMAAFSLATTGRHGSKGAQTNLLGDLMGNRSCRLDSLTTLPWRGPLLRPSAQREKRDKGVI